MQNSLTEGADRVAEALQGPRKIHIALPIIFQFRMLFRISEVTCELGAYLSWTPRFVEPSFPHT